MARMTMTRIHKQQMDNMFGDEPIAGRYLAPNRACADSKDPTLYYEHPRGALWIGDAATWLRTLETGSVDLVFADPPYNIKKAEWDTFESQQAYVEWSLEWIEQAARVLKPAGTPTSYTSPRLRDLRAPAV